MTQLIPYVGMSGLWSVRPPLDAYLPASTVYTCQAVRSFTELIAQELDPLNTIYIPAGLTPSNYNQDVIDGVYIACLTNSLGEWKYIPCSYILTLPTVDGMLYQSPGLHVHLEALPTNIDLTALQAEIAALVQSRLGVTPNVTVEPYGPVELVNYDEYDAREILRQQAIADDFGPQVQIAVLEEDNRALRALIDKLTGCLMGHCNLGGTFTIPLFNPVSPGKNQIIDAADLIVTQPIHPDNPIDLFLYSRLEPNRDYQSNFKLPVFKTPGESGQLDAVQFTPPGGVVQAATAVDLFNFHYPLSNRTMFGGDGGVVWSSHSGPVYLSDTPSSRPNKTIRAMDLTFWAPANQFMTLTAPVDAYVFKEYHGYFENQPIR